MMKRANVGQRNHVEIKSLVIAKQISQKTLIII